VENCHGKLNTDCFWQGKNVANIISGPRGEHKMIRGEERYDLFRGGSNALIKRDMALHSWSGAEKRCLDR